MEDEEDIGEGTSFTPVAQGRPALDLGPHMTAAEALRLAQVEQDVRPPPGYSSPEDENVRIDVERRRSLASEAPSEAEYYTAGGSEAASTPRPGTAFRNLQDGGRGEEERRRLLSKRADRYRDDVEDDEDDETGDDHGSYHDDDVHPSPPIPSYEVAVGSIPASSQENTYDGRAR